MLKLEELKFEVVRAYAVMGLSMLLDAARYNEEVIESASALRCGSEDELNAVVVEPHARDVVVGEVHLAFGPHAEG